MQYMTFDLDLRVKVTIKVPSTPCDLCTCKVRSEYIKWLRRRCIYKKIHHLTFEVDPNPKVKVTQNAVQFPLHHVIYGPAKFAVTMFYDLGGDAFTRNLTEGRTDRRTMDQFW